MYNTLFESRTNINVPDDTKIKQCKAKYYDRPDRRSFGYDEYFSDITGELVLVYHCSGVEVTVSIYYNYRADTNTRSTPIITHSIDIEISGSNDIHSVSANWAEYSFYDKNELILSGDGDDWKYPGHPLLFLDNIYKKYGEEFEDLCWKLENSKV